MDQWLPADFTDSLRLGLWNFVWEAKNFIQIGQRRCLLVETVSKNASVWASSANNRFEWTNGSAFTSSVSSFTGLGELVSKTQNSKTSFQKKRCRQRDSFDLKQANEFKKTIGIFPSEILWVLSRLPPSSTNRHVRGGDLGRSSVSEFMS